MNTKVRRATLADAPALARLGAALDAIHTDAHPHIFQGGQARDLAEVKARLARDDAAIFIARHRGRSAGFIRAEIKETAAGPIFKERRWLVIDELFVAPEARRQGLAGALFEAAVGWGRAQGLEEVEVHVYEFNAEARALYGHLGFETRSRKLSRRLD